MSPASIGVTKVILTTATDPAKMYIDLNSQAHAIWVVPLESCMFVKTHLALLPNCFMLVALIFFVILMATGIYKHNPGPRAFKIMYREVRAFFPPWSCPSEKSYLSSQGLLWLVIAMLVEIVPVVSRAYSPLCVDGAHPL